MALGQAQSAQAAALGAARADFDLRVSAYGNWEEDRTAFTGSGGNNWVAGAQINVDILSFSKRAQLAIGDVSETSIIGGLHHSPIMTVSSDHLLGGDVFSVFNSFVAWLHQVYFAVSAFHTNALARRSLLSAGLELESSCVETIKRGMKRYRVDALMAQNQSEVGCDDELIVNYKDALLPGLRHRYTSLRIRPRASQ